MDHVFNANWLSMIEAVALGCAWLILRRRKNDTRFPAFAAYLSCRLGVLAALLLLFSSSRLGWLNEHVADSASSDVYWAGYAVCAALAFFAIRSIFGRVIQPFAGLHRIGWAGFRWAAAMAVSIAIVSALLPARPNQDLLSEAATRAVRGISVLEVCLLAFTLLSMQTLRFSLKSTEFGIALGLAMMASADLASSVFVFRQPTWAAAVNYGSQIVVALAAVVWAAYSVRPAAEEILVRSAGSSTALGRWNEIASALEEPAPQVYLGEAPGTFFLDDVEKVVDRVMERNAANPGK